MKNYRISLLLAIFTTISFAQVQPTKYIKLISKESLKTNLYVISSDEMEGRNTGTKGQKKAGEYLISQYEKAGISFPDGATDYYQRIPSASLSSRRNGNLPDSENVWAYIQGSEKPNEILVGIMWSAANRHDFYHSGTVPHHHVDIGTEKHRNPVKINKEHNFYIINNHWDDESSHQYFRHFHNAIGSYLYTIEHILRVQWFLKLHNIPYFFLLYKSYFVFLTTQFFYHYRLK